MSDPSDPNDPDEQTEPRPHTKEEMVEKFISQVWSEVNYWKAHARHAGSQEEMIRAIQGVAFSILVVIDGHTGGMPAMNLVPSPHPSDAEYHKSEGENWWPSDVAINDDVVLHDVFYAKLREQTTDEPTR